MHSVSNPLLFLFTVAQMQCREILEKNVRNTLPDFYLTDLSSGVTTGSPVENL